MKSLRQEIEEILFGDEKTKEELRVKMPEVALAFDKNIASILSAIAKRVPPKEDIYCGHTGKDKKQYRNDDAIVRNAYREELMKKLK